MNLHVGNLSQWNVFISIYAGWKAIYLLILSYWIWRFLSNCYQYTFMLVNGIYIYIYIYIYTHTHTFQSIDFYHNSCIFFLFFDKICTFVDYTVTKRVFFVSFKFFFFYIVEMTSINIWMILSAESTNWKLIIHKNTNKYYNCINKFVITHFKEGVSSWCNG